MELSGDETVDPDWAVEAMEYVGHYFDQLTPEAKKSFGEQGARVAAHARKKKWGKEAVEFFSRFMEDFGLVREDDE